MKVSKSVKEALIRFLEANMFKSIEIGNQKLLFSKQFIDYYMELTRNCIAICGFESKNTSETYVSASKLFDYSKLHKRLIKNEENLKTSDKLVIVEISKLYPKIFVTAFENKTVKLNVDGFAEMYSYLFSERHNIKAISKEANSTVNFILNAFYAMYMSNSSVILTSDKSIDVISNYFTELSKYINETDIIAQYVDEILLDDKSDSLFKLHTFLNYHDFEYTEKTFNSIEEAKESMSRGMKRLLKLE